MAPRFAPPRFGQAVRGLRRDAFLLRDRVGKVLSAKTWGATNLATALWRSATRSRQRLVIVTGSVGKTTTTRAAMAVLRGEAPDWVHAGDNCFAHVGWNLVRQTGTSPFAVLEVGIGGPGQMARYAACLRPDVVVMTAIASDHVGRFSDPGGLWEEKAVMVRALEHDGVAVLNGDDPAVLRMAGITSARIVTFGLSAGCDVSARELRLGPRGTRFRIVADGIDEVVDSRVVGREAVRALVAAAAVGRLAGIDPAMIAARLEGMPATPCRMEPIRLRCGATAICDDFKAGNETVHAAIDSLAAIEAERRIVVLGSLFRPRPPRGERYAAVGRRVATFADRIVLVGRRARLYRRGFGALSAAFPVDEVRSIDGAVALLEGVARPGDAVLLKGRGEEKLSRIALRLAGDPVNCPLSFCTLENVVCRECPHARSGGASA